MGMLKDSLRKAVMERDNWRCRWCGAGPGDNLDIHHIEYRRGDVYDVIENLISLCRSCHGFVHAARPNRKGERIVKAVAQTVLFALIEEPGNTGIAKWRQLRAQWRRNGQCETHMIPRQDCPRECWITP